MRRASDSFFDQFRVHLLLLAGVMLPCCRCQEQHTIAPPPARTGSSPGKAIQSLPYLNWNPSTREDRLKKGVTRHDLALALDGLNLYNSKPRHRASLSVHLWQPDLSKLQLLPQARVPPSWPRLLQVLPPRSLPSHSSPEEILPSPQE